MSSDPNDSLMAQSSQSHSSRSVRNKVQKGTTGGYDQTFSIGRDTIHDGSHSVLSDSVAEITSSVVSELGGGRLEIDGSLPDGQVGSCKIGRLYEGRCVSERSAYSRRRKKV